MIGRVGITVIRQASMGMIRFGQITLGFGIGLGQLAIGSAAVGRFASGCVLACGQLAVGFTAIGQLAIVVNALAQVPVQLPF